MSVLLDEYTDAALRGDRAGAVGTRHGLCRP